MIQFEEFELKNGLRFIVNIDKTTPFVAVNTLYNVGSRDENPEQTGFAHLFEHLMFGGSKHIPSFDTPLQKVGGENNAFTTTDITNYYNTCEQSRNSILARIGQNVGIGIFAEKFRYSEKRCV